MAHHRLHSANTTGEGITSSKATRGHIFSHELFHCVIPKELWTAAAGPMFPGCGLWTGPRESAARLIFRGMESPLGNAIALARWPVTQLLLASVLSGSKGETHCFMEKRRGGGDY